MICEMFYFWSNNSTARRTNEKNYQNQHLPAAHMKHSNVCVFLDSYRCAFVPLAIQMTSGNNSAGVLVWVVHMCLYAAVQNASWNRIYWRERALLPTNPGDYGYIYDDPTDDLFQHGLTEVVSQWTQYGSVNWLGSTISGQVLCYSLAKKLLKHKINHISEFSHKTIRFHKLA